MLLQARAHEIIFSIVSIKNKVKKKQLWDASSRFRIIYLYDELSLGLYAHRTAVALHKGNKCRELDRRTYTHRRFYVKLKIMNENEKRNLPMATMMFSSSRIVCVVVVVVCVCSVFLSLFALYVCRARGGCCRFLRAVAVLCMVYV